MAAPPAGPTFSGRWYLPSHQSHMVPSLAPLALMTLENAIPEPPQEVTAAPHLLRTLPRGVSEQRGFRDPGPTSGLAVLGTPVSERVTEINGRTVWRMNPISKQAFVSKNITKTEHLCQYEVFFHQS